MADVSLTRLRLEKPIVLNTALGAGALGGARGACRSMRRRKDGTTVRVRHNPNTLRPFLEENGFTLAACARRVGQSTSRLATERTPGYRLQGCE